jgi:plastocyanin
MRVRRGCKARALFLAPLGAATLLAAPGCGSGGDDPAEPAPATGAIEARDFAFEPADETIERGETVTWTNTGETIHNVKGPGFFSDAINPGDSYEHRFREAGTIKYLCNLHPTMMRGTIEVNSP